MSGFNRYFISEIINRFGGHGTLFEEQRQYHVIVVSQARILIWIGTDIIPDPIGLLSADDLIFDQYLELSADALLANDVIVQDRIFRTQIDQLPRTQADGFANGEGLPYRPTIHKFLTFHGSLLIPHTPR